MKKLFSFVAIALLIMGLAVPAFAAADTVAYGGGSGLNTIRTVTTITATGAMDETNIATTVVIPSKCLLLGYSVVINGTVPDGRVAVIDASSTSTGDKDTQILGESEALTTAPVNIIFPQGIRLTRGLTIKQYQQTAVTVYYIQDRP